MERVGFDVEIGKLIFNFSSKEWLLTKEDKDYTEGFYSVIENSVLNIVTPRVGDFFLRRRRY